MKLRILEVIQEAPYVHTLRFERPADFTFKAGQFVMVAHEHNGQLKTRAYSISSSPYEMGYFSITFKLAPGGEISPHLYELKAGDTLEVKGPYGIFTLDESHMENIVFIAGGVGITPMYSYIKSIVDRKLTHCQISLVYGVRTPADIVFHDELQKIHRENPNIGIYFTVMEDAGMPWPWHRGMISIDFIKESVHDFTGAIYYLCGPPVMVSHIAHDLEAAGINPSRIHMEKW